LFFNSNQAEYFVILFLKHRGDVIMYIKPFVLYF
jgi:hypothetical protein